MATDSQPLGRRERNKQQKLERIVAAASELFAERGVDEVTTQEIAERADIGAGTLFLYAKSKGELLLLVQNAHYAEALERGRAAASATTTAIDAAMAIVQPVVECNRRQVENGRTYLREMAFGDPEEPRRAEALSIAAETEAAIAAELAGEGRADAATAASQARVITAIMFVTMAMGANAAASTADIAAEIRGQISLLLRA